MNYERVKITTFRQHYCHPFKLKGFNSSMAILQLIRSTAIILARDYCCSSFTLLRIFVAKIPMHLTSTTSLVANKITYFAATYPLFAITLVSS
jgi:hypothetical protein